MKANQSPPKPTDPLAARTSLMSTREVTAHLNIQRKAVDSLIAAGKLPVIRIGGRFRFCPEAVRQLIAASTVEVSHA